ncbi:hypothetical protein BH10PSE12_BH10PSE12_09400 [soil metagenome]
MAENDPRGRSAAARWAVRLAIGLVTLIAVLLIALAMFPWGALRDRVTAKLSHDLNRPVTIGRMERIGAFSFHPVIDLQDVRIPQADWARDAGVKADLARIAHARIGFAALPLLIGRFRPETVAIDGMQLAFVRDASGRESWRADRPKPNDRGSGRPAIRDLLISNSSIAYTDGKRDRSFTAALSADGRKGLTLSGNGAIHGQPVTLAARGGPILGVDPAKAWPFSAEIKGLSVGMTASGEMDAPLDVGHLSGRITGHATDLVLLDAIIEAGLPGTQPVKLEADVRRDSPDWTVTALTGTIGRSDIAGHATIVKRNGRTRIDGAVSARRFDFGDLSTNAGKRLAVAKRARFGDRVVPDTAIDLKSVGRTDGRLDLTVKELLWPGSSPFRGLKGTLTLDHSLLTIDPMMLGLTRGRLVGALIIDQRNNAPSPALTVKLDLLDARLLDFFPNTAIDGDLRGRIHIAGKGGTIRLAVGQSTGSVALVAQKGNIPARTASLLGQDIGRGLTTDADKQAVLRCMIARLDVVKGIARPNPVIIDTSRALTRATGSIDLSNERLALLLNGSPKQRSVLRLPGAVPINGTIKQPQIEIPKEARSFGNVLKMLGKGLGKQPVAADSDCRAEAARALL